MLHRPLMQDERLYSASEVAEKLGVSAGAVYKAVSDGQLPALRLGGRILFSWPDVLSHLKAHNTTHNTHHDQTTGGQTQDAH